MTASTEGPDDAAVQALEARALAVGKWGNLFMAASGVLASILSNSQALLVDGLFSLTGFLAAIVGARVAARVNRPADRQRPFGYAAEEALYRSFRALSLIGLVLFAAVNAGLTILDFTRGGEIAPLRFGPIGVYFAVILAVCGGLYWTHRSSWKKTGKRSAMLKLEAQAARSDGLMTLAALFGLSLAFVLRDGPLGGITPIADALVVLMLCGFAIGVYGGEFRAGVAQLAGVSAPPEAIAAARRALRPVLAGAEMELIDLSLGQLGRRYQVIAYVDPGRAVTAAEMDALGDALAAALVPHLGEVDGALVLSARGRARA
jgi:divalent metal cation (Fe/Co/Zn/Cd) transporter